MGLARIDFGGVPTKDRKVFKPLEDDSKVLAEATEFKYKKSAAGNPMIEITFKVTDEDARDIDGGTDYGNVFDRIVFTENAAKMAKLKLKGLGYEVDTLVIESVEDVKELAADLKENFLEKEVILVTENEEYNDKLRTRVKWINEVE